MTDKELLELAAKAAGYKTISDRNSVWIVDEHGDPERRYNPLNDDGDALRLAVNLGITPFVRNDDRAVRAIYPEFDGIEIWEFFGNDKYSATRRVIVRAAAEIGKQLNP